jgi:hypothetical protein
MVKILFDSCVGDSCYVTQVSRVTAINDYNVVAAGTVGDGYCCCSFLLQLCSKNC